MKGNGQLDWFGFGKLEKAFWATHYRHPIICDTLTSAALARKAAGLKRCSIQLLYEQIRHSLPLELDSDGLKLNNNHCAFYARLIEEREPQLKGFFRLRRQRIQSSFGPKNEELPPSEHIS